MPARSVDGLPPAEFPLHVLQEYSLLADGERGILVGPRGDFAWMCVPRWDSDVVFSTLIDGGGMYAITPTEQPFVWGGFYEENSLIWHSRWVTCSQSLESREALAFPGDAHTAVVLRRVMAVDGGTQVRVVLEPRAGFGDHRMSYLKCREGAWTSPATAHRTCTPTSPPPSPTSGTWNGSTTTSGSNQCSSTARSTPPAGPSDPTRQPPA